MLEKAILLKMLLCLEEKILSIITAIFQAIGQALTFILPTSESGHNAIFNDFSARYTGVASELTGLIHIGIAIGILIAFYKVFLRLFVDFVNTGRDIFSKNFSLKNAGNSRKFMLYTILAYIPLLLYFIPTGSKGNVYQFIDSYSYDGNLLSESIGFLISALVVILASFTLQKNQKGKQLDFPVALLLSVGIFVTLPFSGLSLCAMLISLAIICNINKNIAVRYFISISVPVLLVQGIIEIVNCVNYVTIITGVVAVIISAAASFFFAKLLKLIVSGTYLKYFSYYNLTIGIVTLVTGIVQMII